MPFRVIEPAPGHVSVTTKVELEGNFFTKDPGKTFRHNVMDMLDLLAKDMQDELRRQIADKAGEMPAYDGWSWAHTIGYTTSGKTGRRWTTWAAVGAVTAGMDKKDAIRTKALVAGRHTPRAVHPDGTTPGIEGRFHPYRSVKAGIYRSRALLTADLTKGLD